MKKLISLFIKLKDFLPKRKLTHQEFLLVPEVFWKLFLARLKVSFLPSVRYLPLNSGESTILLSQEKFCKAKTIATVINGLSIRTPWSSTCLVQVLAAHKMLEKRKIPHTLHFGIKKNTLLQFDAHSWLSVGMEVILGGGNLFYYKEISQIMA